MFLVLVTRQLKEARSDTDNVSTIILSYNRALCPQLVVFRILSTRSKYATVPSNMIKVFVSYNTVHRVENGDPQKFGFKSFHKNRSKRQQLSRNFIQIPVLQLIRNQYSCRRPYSDLPKSLIVLEVVPSSLPDRSLSHSHPSILLQSAWLRVKYFPRDHLLKFYHR